MKNIVPLVIYDNQCYLCTKFAKFVNFLARRKILLVGHYSKLGKELREKILDSSALEMFWFIDGKMAYGGRAALLPLFNTILFSRKKYQNHPDIQDACDSECKTIKAVFVRSSSLIRNSKKIPIIEVN